MGSARIVKSLLGIVKAKLNAIFIGTTGVGIVSQVNFTAQQLSLFTLMGMNDGLTKQIAESKSDKDFRDIFCSAQKSYILLSGLITILSMFFILAFSKKLNIYFFGEEKYYKYFLIAVSIFPILLINSYSHAILKSFKAIKYIARAELISSIASFIVFIPLIYFFKIYGAVAAIVGMFLTKLIINIYNAKKNILSEYNIQYKDILNSKLDRRKINELILFGGVGLTLGLYQIVVEIAGRGIIINKLGIDKLGVYSPNMTLGGMFKSVIEPALLTYLYPRFSELKNENKKITSIVNDSWRMVTFFSALLLFGGISLRFFVIPLLYSSEFIEAALYIPGHFLGIFFHMLLVPLGQVFTPTGRIKIFYFFQILNYTLALIIMTFLIPLLGLTGWMLRFIIPPLIFSFVYYIYLNKKIGLKIFKKNLLLIVYLLVSSLILYFISNVNTWLSMLLAIMFTGALYFLLTDKEKKVIINKINYYLKFKR